MGWRQLLVVVGLALGLLGACASEKSLRTEKLVEGNFGGIAGDEPHAVLAARDVIASGGSAADAAVALYFTAAVTYPVASSLGAGGVCLVFDQKERVVRTLAFEPSVPAGVDAARPVAVPGAVRAMFALQARYGVLQWSRLLAPAEELARLGHKVSRAFARELARTPRKVFSDPSIARLFLRADDTPLKEGDLLVQLDLAGVISQIRTKGPGVFYSGDLARTLSKGIIETGGGLTAETLRDYRPAWRGTVELPFGDHVIHSVPPPMSGGTTTLEQFAMLARDGRYAKAPPGDRPHLFAEIALRAFADRQSWLGRLGALDPASGPLAAARTERLMANYVAERHMPPETLSPAPQLHREAPAGMSFAVVDGTGAAVACAITMSRRLGAGYVIPGTGIVPATPPLSPGGDLGLSPVMMVNHNVGEFLFAGAASGGVVAPSALTEAMARAMIGGEPLVDAIAAPRVINPGVPDITFVEKALGAEAVADLRRRGHKTRSVAAIGRVNAIYCRDGFRAKAETCEYEADERGHGLAAIVQF